jgi:hypothetical protein
VRNRFGWKPRSQTNLPSAYDDGLSQAITLVVAPLLFALLGVWIDSRLGTSPVFALVLAVFALVGVATSTYYRYLHRSAQLDEGKPWTRRDR